MSMRSQIQALAWELFCKGRGSLYGALALTIACSMVTLLLPQSSTEPFYGFLIFLMVCALFLTFSAFHYAEHNPQKQWHGFPYRLFTLPVPTIVLISVPMLLGLAGVELMYFGWAGLVFAPLGHRIDWWPAFAVGVGILCYHSLVWGLAGYRGIRITALAIGGIVLMDLGAAPMFVEIVPWTMAKIHAISGAALAVFATGAFLGAWYAVEQQRRGGGRGRNWIRLLAMRVLDILPRRKRPFRSVAAAQFWYEWRRAGWILPLAVAAALIFVFLPISWFTRKDQDCAFWILGWAMVLPVVLAAVIGPAFSRADLWTGELPMFVVIRPISSGDLVVAKMKVAALSVVWGWAAVIGFIGLWIPGWARTSEIRDGWAAVAAIHGRTEAVIILVLGVLLAMLMTWRGLVDSLWLSLGSSRARTILFHTCQLLAVGFGIWWVFHFDFHREALEKYVRVAGWSLGILILTKVWLAVFAWRYQTPARTWQYAAAWCGGTAIGVLLIVAACPNIPWLKELLVLAALLPMPLARLGLAPGALAKSRHKA